MARVLLLMTRPLAGAGGRGQVLQTIVSSIAANGHQVVCAVVGGPGRPDPIVDAVAVHRLPDVSMTTVLLGRQAARRGLRSWNERLYWSDSVADEVRHIVAEESIDAVIADGVRLAAYAEDSGAPWFVDLDDLLSARYELWHERRMDLYQLLGHRRPAHRVPAALLRRIPVNRLLEREAATLAQREVELARTAGGISLVSRIEAAYLEERSGQRVEWLPMAVGVAAEPAAGAVRGLDRRLAFAGSLTAFANEEAVRWWIDELEPAIRASGLEGWELHVFGVVPDAVRARVEAESVVLEGSFTREELHERLAAFTFALAPQREALGLTVKVVEAAVLGMVALTTPQGASGFDVVHGREVLLFHDGPDLARVLTAVEEWARDDPEALAELAARGRSWATSTFSAEALRGKWGAVLGRLLEAHPVTARPGARVRSS